MGGWYGGKLQQAGHDVTFVARGATLERLRSRGVTLNGETIGDVRAVGTTGELQDIDVAILCVKVTPETDLDALLELPAGVPVALTQNSVETPQLVADTLGEDRVWPGVVRGFFHHVGPAEVEYHGGPITFTFGGADEAGVAALAEALGDAGVEAIVAADPLAEVWEKAIQVAPSGALGLLAGTSLGQLRTTYRPSLKEFMEEIAAVAESSGVHNPGMVERTLAFCDTLPAEATTSMQRDEAAGLPSELDAQVGAIVRAGERTGTPTPLHRLAWTLLSNR